MRIAYFRLHPLGWYCRTELHSTMSTLFASWSRNIVFTCAIIVPVFHIHIRRSMYNWANSLQVVEPHVGKGLGIAKLVRVGSRIPRARKPPRVAVLDRDSKQAIKTGVVELTIPVLLAKTSSISTWHSRNWIRLTIRAHESVGWAVSSHSWSEFDLKVIAPTVRKRPGGYQYNRPSMMSPAAVRFFSAQQSSMFTNS